MYQKYKLCRPLPLLVGKVPGLLQEVNIFTRKQTLVGQEPREASWDPQLLVSASVIVYKLLYLSGPFVTVVK